jgi:hypothetical protein
MSTVRDYVLAHPLFAITTITPPMPISMPAATAGIMPAC